MIIQRQALGPRSRCTCTHPHTRTAMSQKGGEKSFRSSLLLLPRTQDQESEQPVLLPATTAVVGCSNRNPDERVVEPPPSSSLSWSGGKWWQEVRERERER